MNQAHRQQPGLACEECRRRKLRCDRVRPSCGSCQESHATCHYVDKRPPRGPRKGQMLALKNLVAELEQRLSEQSGQRQPQNQHPAPSSTFQVLLEQDPPPVAPIDLDSPGLGVSAFEGNTFVNNAEIGGSTLGATSIASSSHGSTSIEAPSFASSSLVSMDISSVGEMPPSPENIILSDHTFGKDWLDHPILPSPATTPSAQPFLTPSHMLSDLMQADLDELYFDRVHPVAPNIHRRNYFTWASKEYLPPARMALQCAMRAVAAAVSAQYRPLSGMLCAQARRLLEQIDASGAGDCSDTPIEQIQAWLLVAHWELLCKHEHQAMLTAGRAIRMVQLTRLHEVDASSVPFASLLRADTPLSMSDEESFVEAEEKRRTFWLAYCFDQFCLMRSECPPSLQEESIRTRLPAPEAHFQNNQPVRMDFLPEVLAHNCWNLLSPFSECIVLTSLFSRCISHQRFATAENLSSAEESRKFWGKYTHLAMAVEKRRKRLIPQGFPGSGDVADDPMLAFVHALSACVATYVYQSMAVAMNWSTTGQEAAGLGHEEQAVQAAGDLVHLIKSMPRSTSHFKSHPFLPCLIHRSIVSLMGLPRSLSPPTSSYSSRDKDVDILLGALRGLQHVNNLSRSILTKLEEDGFGTRLMGEQRDRSGSQTLCKTATTWTFE